MTSFIRSFDDYCSKPYYQNNNNERTKKEGNKTKTKERENAPANVLLQPLTKLEVEHASANWKLQKEAETKLHRANGTVKT